MPHHTPLIATIVAVRRLRISPEPDALASVDDLRGTGFEGAALAVAWSVPVLLFGRYGDSATPLALSMVPLKIWSPLSLSSLPR